MLREARVEATVPTSDLERARRFYEDKLGLVPAERAPRGREAVYECGQGTRLLLYERPSAGTAAHTLAHFIVSDLEATVEDLRSRGVDLEEYDLPGIRTENGIADFGDFKAAWVKDPDGNVVGINSLGA